MEVEQLFSRVNKILDHVKIYSDQCSARGERFNIFHVCRMDYEENRHSDVITELLNPQGTHGQGNAFLKLFLETLQPQTGFTFDADPASVKVAREVSVSGEGRIDILITNGKQAIIIENKIYATDRWKQLQRYNSHAEGKYGKGNYLIIYLTLDGREASEYSCGDIDYLRLSYRRDVLSWIDKCIGYGSALPLIRETLVQYSNLIKKLTHQNMEQKFSKEQLMAAMPNNADAVAAITNAQDEFRKYAFEHYTRLEFQKFADEQNLKYDDSELFSGQSYRGFSFRKQEWGKMAIWICTGSRSYCNFFIGIHCNDLKRTETHEYLQLKCLSDKANDSWPFGTVSLGEYSNWDMNTVAAMVSGGGEVHHLKGKRHSRRVAEI